MLAPTLPELNPLTENTNLQSPSKIILIRVSIIGDNTLYAVVNTTVGPSSDRMILDLLACFESIEETEIFKEMYSMEGDPIEYTLDEARQIAISKPKLHGLGIQREGKTADVIFVR